MERFERESLSVFVERERKSNHWPVLYSSRKRFTNRSYPPQLSFYFSRLEA